jgi:hypothetical protein
MHRHRLPVVLTLRRILPGLGALLLLGIPGGAQVSADHQRGLAAWERRAEGARDGRAAPEPIAEAVAAFEAALRADPRDLGAAAALLRALWFQGEYATVGTEAKKVVFDRGRKVGEQAQAELGRRVGQDLGKLDPAATARLLGEIPEAVPIHFWTAVHWGLWGEAFGKMAAARQGVAGRIRDLCQVVLALDAGFEHGGGHRVLGRLHARAPRVPFFTGWISRDTAVAELRRAVAVGPESSFNRLYLAEALAEGDAAERAEAKTLLAAVAATESSPDGVVELAANRARARELLGAK